MLRPPSTGRGLRAEHDRSAAMSMPRAFVEFARDARIHHQLFPGTDLQASLRGRITRNDRRGGISFLTLVDVTDAIQLVVERNAVGEAAWENVRRIARGSSVRATGHIGETSAGVVSVFLTAAPQPLPPVSQAALLADEFQEVGTQVLLARLTAVARRFFRRHHFTELEAKLLSTSWPEAGLNPLRVSYSGFGPLHFYLAVSPMPQLSKALIATRQRRVFTITRCFTSSYLDHVSGVESIILSAQMLDTDLSAVGRLAADVLRAVLGDFSTRPKDKSEDFEIIQRPNLTWPPQEEYLTITKPELQFFDDIGGSAADHPLFRLCWPPDYLLAEGFVYPLTDDSLPCAGLTLNLERVIPLLQSGDFRRVLNRGATGTAVIGDHHDSRA